MSSREIFHEKDFIDIKNGIQIEWSRKVEQASGFSLRLL
jgi:hypothetical protein